MKRKSPVRHIVKGHRREGREVRSYERGSRKPFKLHSRKIVSSNKFSLWTQRVNNEDKIWSFEKLPVIVWGDDTKSDTVEKGGRIVVAKIIIDKIISNHPKLLEIVVKHELRENLAFQNYACEAEAHNYAKRHEKRDLKRIGLTLKEYNKLIKEVGYEP